MTVLFHLSLPEEQGAPRQGEALEWVRRQATQVAGVLTKQLVAPDRRCRTGPKPVLQSLGLQATEVAGGVGHPIHSSAVSPQPHIVAASQLDQQGLIFPGKHTRLLITGIVSVHLPGAGVVRGGSRVTLLIAAQALDKVTALGGEG